MKKNVIIMLVLIGALNTEICFSQASMTVYSTEVIGIKSSLDKLIGGELKFFSKIPTGRIEYDMFVNFKKQTYHQLSIGLGLNVNTSVDAFFNAYTMPFCLTVTPFVECKSPLVKRLSFVFEICPEFYPNYNYNGEQFYLRNLCGLRFKFKD